MDWYERMYAILCTDLINKSYGAQYKKWEIVAANCIPSNQTWYLEFLEHLLFTGVQTLQVIKMQVMTMQEMENTSNDDASDDIASD